MSPTDQQGKAPLTRKQLRELRLTGATPVVTTEEATEATEAAKADADRNATAQALPRAAAPTPIPPAPTPDSDVDLGAAPLTRRQAREQERLRTASVPVIGDDAAEQRADAEADELVSAVPAFAPADAAAEADEDQLEDVSGETSSDASEPAENADSGDMAVEAEIVEVADEDAASDDPDHERDVHPVEALLQAGSTHTDPTAIAATELSDAPPASEPAAEDDKEAEAELLNELAADAVASDDADADDEGALDSDPVSDEGEQDSRLVVNEAFGSGVLADEERALAPSFDDLITTGSNHIAPSAVIFNPPARGSLSGPVAASGEMLVTGSYDLPSGLGSRGFADGVADGSDIDAVLLDGELPATSSPTPIAASAAVSTSKPAGEVIRPPVPEKGNKLMLTLAIVAGGLALVLAAALVVAFTMNVL